MTNSQDSTLERPAAVSRLSSSIACLLAFWTVGLAANLCFKQGGTDVAHRPLYFVAGCAFGVISTWFVVRLYARMNVNLAALLVNGGSFLLFQTACWFFFATRLTVLQWVGILAVLVGMVLAMKSPAATAVEAPRREPSLEIPGETVE